MRHRIDEASRLILAPPPEIYRAFGSAEALESWLPPTGMKGKVLSFSFRGGGGYRIRLTYTEQSHGRGKTSEDSDEVQVRFLHLLPDRLIEQVVDFVSEEPEFAGSMKMTWSFEAVGEGTEVTVRCEDVPEGIRPEDHEAGLTSTLDNLAKFTEGARGSTGAVVMDTEQRAAILDLSERPSADADDVSSPEAIVRALYDAISGPAEKDQERDWDRVRSLFLPDAQFVLVRWSSPDGQEEEALRAWDVEGFIETSRQFYHESRFFEREIFHRTERFGHIAHVFSTYEARVDPEDSDPVMRGINSVQVVHDGARWWIANLVWDMEGPTNPIPEAYLPELIR